MINQPLIFGIYIGLGMGVIYLFIHGIKKQKPDFGKFAVLFLSCVGVVVAIDFGHTVITEPAANFGKLQDQRLPMVLGAGAITWISIEQICVLYLRILQVKNRK